MCGNWCVKARVLDGLMWGGLVALANKLVVRQVGLVVQAVLPLAPAPHTPHT